MNDLHRWCGFTRFSAGKDGVLYARIAPEQEVLDGLAPFFSARLRGQRWVIVDTTHECTAVFDGRHYEIRPAQPEDLLPPAGEPDMIEGLWQEYFKTI